MKKLSKISEGILGDIARRDLHGGKRKEDEIGNIKKIQPVDMGCSVLWADRDFEINGKYMFTFDEVSEFTKNSGWRLPTLKEVAELDNDCVIDYKKGIYYFYKNRNILEFKPNGFYYKPLKYKCIDPYLYYAWSSTPLSIKTLFPGKKYHIFIFDENIFYYTPPDKIDLDNIVVQNESDKLCVRLVKEKENGKK